MLGIAALLGLLAAGLAVGLIATDSEPSEDDPVETEETEDRDTAEEDESPPDAAGAPFETAPPSGPDTGAGSIGILFGVMADGTSNGAATGGSPSEDRDQQILGGEADDRLEGGHGNDTLHAGGGDDHLRGHAGDDLLRGEEGNDTLRGEAGDDTLLGGGGDDRLFGGAGKDWLAGGLGDDHLQAGHGGQATLDGDGGNDTLIGSWFEEAFPENANYLNGGDGDDLLRLGGRDIASGGAGGDIFEIAYRPETATSSRAEGYDIPQILDFNPDHDRLVILHDPAAGVPSLSLQAGGLPDEVLILANGQPVLQLVGASGLSMQDILLSARGGSAG